MDQDVPATPPRIAALAADLLFTAKIKGAADALGVPIALARNAAALLDTVRATQPDLVILDLDTRGLDIAGTIDALRSAAPAAEVLAYVSHVRVDAIETARTAGAKVLARSAFTRMLPEILQR